VKPRPFAVSTHTSGWIIDITACSREYIEEVTTRDDHRSRLVLGTTLVAAWVVVASLVVRMDLVGLRHVLATGHLAGIVLWTFITHATTILAIPLVAIASWRGARWAYVTTLGVAVHILLYSAYLWSLVGFDIARMRDPPVAGPALVAGVTALSLITARLGPRRE
jgi:hypothetical protein